MEHCRKTHLIGFPGDRVRDRLIPAPGKIPFACSTACGLLITGTMTLCNRCKGSRFASQQSILLNLGSTRHRKTLVKCRLTAVKDLDIIC